MPVRARNDLAGEPSTLFGVGEQALARLQDGLAVAGQAALPRWLA